MLEILVGLSGVAALPFLSPRHYYVEQIGHLALTAGFFASLPTGVTLAVIFLSLNSACYLGRESSPWRTRFAAGVFLALQAPPHWHLVVLAACYSAMVATVTIMDNRGQLQEWFTGKKRA